MTATNTLTPQTRQSFGKIDWDRYAICYDTLNHLIPYQGLIDAATKQLEVDSKDVILDAGCGTGNLITHILRDDVGATIHGIDRSQPMLKLAKEKTQGSSTNLQQADLNTTLPFQDHTFSKIATVNSLYAVNDPEFTLREFSRILKTNGKLIIATPIENFENGYILKSHCKSKKSNEYWKDAHRTPGREKVLINEAIADPNIAEMMLQVAEINRRIKSETEFNFFKPIELETLVQKCGFEITSKFSSYADQGILLSAKKVRTQ